MAKKGPRCEKCGSRKTRVVSKEKLEEITRTGESHPWVLGVVDGGGGNPWDILVAVAKAIESIFDWLTQRERRWVFCKKCGHLKDLND